MTRSTISPPRRVAATLGTLGVLGFGAVAVAPAALADDQAPVAPVASTSAPSYIQAPLPAGPIQVTLGFGHATVTLPPHAAQVVNTIEANLYASQGYQVTFTETGMLVIGPKFCDPTKSAAWNQGCVDPGAARF